LVICLFVLSEWSTFCSFFFFFEFSIQKKKKKWKSDKNCYLVLKLSPVANVFVHPSTTKSNHMKWIVYSCFWRKCLHSWSNQLNKSIQVHFIKNSSLNLYHQINDACLQAKHYFGSSHYLSSIHDYLQHTWSFVY
jgi:hypothetical protein